MDLAATDEGPRAGPVSSHQAGQAQLSCEQQKLDHSPLLIQAVFVKKDWGQRSWLG